ncbi:MAG: hypothetical protein QOF76_4238 [Solirubrobacteraceae bacterium]|jgi:hypothetical protein|nr:hypothetical protein [Solirubrobacteraceae bacterium]
MRALGLIVALAVGLSACGSSDDKDTTTTDTSSNRAQTYTPPAKTPSAPEHVMKVVYDEPTTNAEATAKEILDLGGLGGIADGFSKNFKLPVDVEIHVTGGDGSPFYDPQTHSITLYYDFVNLTADILKQGEPGITQNELGKQWAAVDDFIFIHEMGHAFVDLFDIPITGREEDAVDGMATVFFTDDVPGGAEYAFDAARFFGLLQDVQGSPDATQFADEHSLSVQRAYDIACAVAGSSEETMQQIAALNILPKERLARCPAEYEQKSKAWKVLLKPHLRTS